MVVWFRTRLVAVLFACLCFPVIAAYHTYEDDTLDLAFHRDTYNVTGGPALPRC
jgi:hypothetical protein